MLELKHNLKLNRECKINYRHCFSDYCYVIISGNKVVVYSASGKHKLKEYICEYPPISAVFSCFSSDLRVEKVIAILVSKDHLRLHMFGGQTFDILSPFPISKIFPCKFGLLVQRYSLSAVTGPSSHSHDNTLLYSISNLMDPMRPISIEKNENLKNAKLALETSNLNESYAAENYHLFDSEEQVVVVCDDIIFSTNLDHSKLKIWTVQPAINIANILSPESLCSPTHSNSLSVSMSMSASSLSIAHENISNVSMNSYRSYNSNNNATHHSSARKNHYMEGLLNRALRTTSTPGLDQNLSGYANTKNNNDNKKTYDSEIQMTLLNSGENNNPFISFNEHCQIMITRSLNKDVYIIYILNSQSGNISCYSLSPKVGRNNDKNLSPNLKEWYSRGEKNDIIGSVGVGIGIGAERGGEARSLDTITYLGEAKGYGITSMGQFEIPIYSSKSSMAVPLALCITLSQDGVHLFYGLQCLSKNSFPLIWNDLNYDHDNTANDTLNMSISSSSTTTTTSTTTSSSHNEWNNVIALMGGVSNHFIAQTRDGSHHILAAPEQILQGEIAGLLEESLLRLLPLDISIVCLRFLILAEAQMSIFSVPMLLLSAFGLHRLPNLLDLLFAELKNHDSPKIDLPCILASVMECADEVFQSLQTTLSGSGFIDDKSSISERLPITHASYLFDLLHCLWEDWRLSGLLSRDPNRQFIGKSLYLLTKIASRLSISGRCFADHYSRCLSSCNCNVKAMESGLVTIMNQSGVTSISNIFSTTNFTTRTTCIVSCAITWLTQRFTRAIMRINNHLTELKGKEKEKENHSNLNSVDVNPIPNGDVNDLQRIISDYSSLCPCIIQCMEFLSCLQKDESEVRNEIDDLFSEQSMMHSVTNVTSAGSDGGGRRSLESRLIFALYKCGGSRRSRYSVKDLPQLLQLVGKAALVLYRTSLSQSSDWHPELLISLQRDDLAAASLLKTKNKNYVDDLYINTTSAMRENKKCNDTDIDGLLEVQRISLLRFAHDDRVKEVCRLLRSSKPLFLKLPHNAMAGGDEEDSVAWRHKQQIKLLGLCRRSLASCIGRGLLTFASLEALVAEPLPIPPLALSGRVPPTGSIVQLDTSSAPPDLTLWSEFHNGVAAGLRLNAKSSGITRTWILYNRPAEADTSHAGVLFALGLLGHLRVLTVTDVCDYLTMGHEPTSMAILMGLSASKIGTADPLLSKTLCLHLPSLLPVRRWEIEISPLVQASALMGLGLLHCGTGHRLMVEFLLSELGRKVPSDRVDYKEAISIATGWALGMVLLGKGATNEGVGEIGGGGEGGSMVGLSDLRIEDRLQRLIEGGRRDREYNLFSPDLMNEAYMDANSKSSRVMEGEEFNTNITSPGACIALALMYLKTNNATVAKRLALPTTAYAIDSISSDLLTFRSLARCLIMWDSVVPSDEWLESLIPEILKSTTQNASDLMPIKVSAMTLSMKMKQSSYLCAIAGACLGMGIVFAGTADNRVKAVLLKRLKTLQGLRDVRLVSMSTNRVSKPLIEMCLSAVSLGLAAVMAGSGDLDCLRTLRELRWKFDDTYYGSQLSNSMCTGLLFLAGGQASLRRHDMVSIASLVLAFCPRFPIRSSDQQFHVQAFRHVSVLAVEMRALQPLDVITGRPVSIDIEVELKDGKIVILSAPCLLPELSEVSKVHSKSEEYFPVSMDIISILRSQQQPKRSGHLSLPPMLLRRKPLQTTLSLGLSQSLPPSKLDATSEDTKQPVSMMACLRQFIDPMNNSTDQNIQKSNYTTISNQSTDSSLLFWDGIGTSAYLAIDLISNRYSNQDQGEEVVKWNQEPGTAEELNLFNLITKYNILRELILRAEEVCDFVSPKRVSILLTLSKIQKDFEAYDSESNNDLRVYAETGNLPQDSYRRRNLSDLLIYHNLPSQPLWPIETAKIILDSCKGMNSSAICNLLRIGFFLKSINS